MGIAVTIIIIVLIIALIWILVELRRFKHKFFAILLIALILVSYFGFAVTLKGKDINYKSIDGLQTVAKLYFIWIGSIFKNFKTITANAIKLNWKGDSSSLNEKNISNS
ncbi:MAG: hypothetical protein Q8O84_02385 [Nanoarchaeota archaeon]|nr:hypothetical protein [Nanoarchaeota archaeon]